MPNHGEERNRHVETEAGPAKTFKGPDGKVVYYGPVVSSTQTVCERWCEKCGEWVRCAGILNHIACYKCNTWWQPEE